MDEMMNLVNGIGMNATEVTRSLSEIGNGNMLDGIRNIYYNAMEVGEGIGYRRRLLEEAFEASENNIRQKFLIGGVCLLVGAGATAGGIWLAKKLRAKNLESDTPSVQFINDDTIPDEVESDPDTQSI